MSDWTATSALRPSSSIEPFLLRPPLTDKETDESWDIFIINVKKKFEADYEQLLRPVFLCFPQIPGRLFSPSDIRKKLSHHFLLHFSIGIMGV